MSGLKLTETGQHLQIPKHRGTYYPEVLARHDLPTASSLHKGD